MFNTSCSVRNAWVLLVCATTDACGTEQLTGGEDARTGAVDSGEGGNATGNNCGYTYDCFRAMPTGSFPECTNELGTFDVTGNVWEVVPSTVDPRGFEVRGGAYNCATCAVAPRGTAEAAEITETEPAEPAPWPVFGSPHSVPSVASVVVSPPTNRTGRNCAGAEARLQCTFNAGWGQIFGGFRCYLDR